MSSSSPRPRRKLPPLPNAHAGLLLRDFADCDVPIILGVAADPEMYSWLAFSAPLADSQAVRRWIRESQALYALDNGVRAAVVDEDSNRLLGCVELRIDADGVATAGYWTVHAERGRGIARGALKIIVDWAFANDLVWAVDLLTLPGNTASEHVALACGFRRDGVHTTYDRRLGHEVTFNAFTLSNSAAIIAEPSSPEDSTTNL